jgi:soluble lytic murein transglycosylase-like protein
MRKMLLSALSILLTASTLMGNSVSYAYAQSPPKKVVTYQKKTQIYNPRIPMKKEYQEYLYKLCLQRGLDYKKTLALIKTESSFNPKAHGGNNYGYFQVNKINHASLSKKLRTPNKPYDPYVNINWGTYMLSDLYRYWKNKGIKGRQLDEYVWSSYNRGLNGFKKHGKAYSYINKMRKNIEYINRLF